MINLRTAIRAMRSRASRREIPMHSAESLRYLVKRERFRSDRSGLEFALVAVRFLDSTERSAHAEESIVVWLQRELRITDDVGLLDDGRIGVLLPDTDRDGAEVVADRIRLECTTFELANEIEISVYPDHDGTPTSTSTSESERKLDPAKESISLMQSMFIEPIPTWKRAFDMLGSGAAIVVTLPLQLAIAVAIKATSPGPVLFTQSRSGLGGQPYRIFKFRTMCVDAEDKQHLLAELNEQDGPAFKLKSDPRLTRLGSFLRKTSLDELPQLWNVFRGEMSLVGPRPLPCHEAESCNTWQQYRLDVTPGITCIWQVYGRSRVSFDRWIRMDIEYIRSRSPLQDAHLLCMTLPAVLSGRGAV